MRRFLSIILVGTLALGIAACAKKIQLLHIYFSSLMCNINVGKIRICRLNCQEDILTGKGIGVVK